MPTENPTGQISSGRRQFKEEHHSGNITLCLEDAVW